MKSLTVIIPYSTQENILEELIISAWQLDPIEIIILLRNSKSGLYTIAKKHKCRIFFEDRHIENHSGYVTALKAARGEVLLFLDGNFSVPTAPIREFIKPILINQTDVILNDLNGIIDMDKCHNLDIVWRKMLNEILHRPDLKGNTLISMPYALTKEVMVGIGYEVLKKPILSHMILVDQGWYISHCYSINMLSNDELLQDDRYLFKEKLTDAEKLKIKNYLVVLSKWLKKYGTRGGFTDWGKRRDIIEQLSKYKHFPSYQKGWGMKSSIYDGKQLSVIIPAQNEEATIEQVIREARKIEPYEILVVVNGSDDQTAAIASSLGATVIEYAERLGHNVGRAIGALEATGDILLFVDGDFSIPASDLHRYTQAVADGMDIALNNLNPSLNPPFYIVDIVKYMLNLAYNRPELSNGSLVAIPHAISRSCIEGIGWESLLCPSLAQVKAIIQGYRVECIHYVDVVKPNRIRSNEHINQKGHPPAVLRIMGDHIEALSYLIKHLDLHDDLDMRE